MENFKNKFYDYLLLEKNYSQHTVTAYINDIGFFESFLSNEFEDDNLLRINYNQIRSWIVSLSDDGISNASINRKVSSLTSFYKFLLKTKQIDTSPLLKHKALKAPKKIQIPFSEKELDMVLNQIMYKEGFEGVRDKLIVDLFYTTGIRRTELINLKIRNVDLSNKTIKVIGKRNKERIIPISKELHRQINSYLQTKNQHLGESRFVFSLKFGKKLYPMLVYRIINRYLSIATNLDKTSPHVLRHTFATHMLNRGTGLETLKDLLGHANLSATQVYTHNSFAQLNSIYSQTHPRGGKK